MTQAWRVARRLVTRYQVPHLLTGLERLRVVSIGLDVSEDPQQIFGEPERRRRPLTESEKVKNWLLMGLAGEEQQDLHDNHWLKIERALRAERTSEPIDTDRICTGSRYPPGTAAGTLTCWCRAGP